jgi:hypothetical protein
MAYVDDGIDERRLAAADPRFAFVRTLARQGGKRTTFQVFEDIFDWALLTREDGLK